VSSVGEHRLAPFVGHGDRLGEVDQNRLHAFLETTQVRIEAGVVDRQRSPPGELADEIEILLGVARLITQAQNRECPERAPAREQRRDDRRAISVVKHEALVLGPLGE
jgi:hypothetical protein